MPIKQSKNSFTSYGSQNAGSFSYSSHYGTVIMSYRTENRNINTRFEFRKNINSYADENYIERKLTIQI